MNNGSALKVCLVLLLATMVAGMAITQETKSVDQDSFHLEWTVDGVNLNIRVSAPTEGWIAVGFNPSNKMKDANIIIGYVENGSAVVEDHFATGIFSHKRDIDLGGTSDVSNVVGTESSGTTVLMYTMPLDSSDEYDRPLVAGRTYKVILASDKKDRISAKHNERTSVEITL